MGLNNNTGGGSQYVSFRKGKFYLGKDKETSYNELEGKITNLSYVDDEFEGKPMRKLVIKMTDGEQNYILSVISDSSYATQFISFLKNADLTDTLSLVGTSKTGEDGKEKIGLLVKQNDTFLKGYYTKADPKGLPQMKQITVNKKLVWDKSDYLEFLENVVTDELAPAVLENKPAKVSSKEPLPNLTNGGEEDLDQSNLPF